MTSHDGSNRPSYYRTAYDHTTYVVKKRHQEKIDKLASNGVDLPTGKYATIVIDPPWKLNPISRRVRRNDKDVIGLIDYPTMTEQEIKRFPIDTFASSDCHLYMWVTQSTLTQGLRIIDYWGFSYRCLLTWVKNVGYTPFSFMFSTEHIIFAVKGTLPLLKLGKRLDFYEQRREHSRKPEKFYNLVKEVSPGPRIDIFSRQKREGFDQYGNDVELFNGNHVTREENGEVKNNGNC